MKEPLNYHIMGHHYTCEYCGTYGKGMYFCDCYDKRSKEVFNMKIGATILDAFMYEEADGSILCEKLQKDDKVFCIYTDNGSCNLVDVEKFNYDKSHPFYE